MTQCGRAWIHNAVSQQAAAIPPPPPPLTTSEAYKRMNAEAQKTIQKSNSLRKKVFATGTKMESARKAYESLQAEYTKQEGELREAEAEAFKYVAEALCADRACSRWAPCGPQVRTRGHDAESEALKYVAEALWADCEVVLVAVMQK